MHAHIVCRLRARSSLPATLTAGHYTVTVINSDGTDATFRSEISVMGLCRL